MANRRDFIGLCFAAGSFTAAAAESAIAHVPSITPLSSGAPVDALSLVPSELRGALDSTLKIYGDLEVNADTLPALRKTAFEQMKPVDSPRFERRVIPGPQSAPDVPVFVINPSSGRKPAILHIHGGGYVLEKAESYVPMLQLIARELDCVVVTVDYRLAPETVFPGALEDNYAALRWLWSSADQLGIDTRRIAVMGESAGGGHAAMLAIAVRDRREFKFAAQVLIYPMLDDRTGSTRSVPAHIGTYIWTRNSNRFGWSSLLGRPAGSRFVPAGSVPARVTDLSGLPPTFIGVGSIDLFVAEDIAFANRLVAAGVPVELLVVPGGYHGFDDAAAEAPLSKRFREAQLGALRRAFA